MKPHEITDLCACLCLAISLPCAAHAALDVQCVSGPALKFREGGDTIVVMYSNATIRVTESGTLDMLLVGGGGGGGTQGGGGGGGGGVVYTQNFEVVAGTYEINVGMGGDGAWSNKVASANGGDSSAFGVVAYGGGAGGSYAGPTGSGYSHPGQNGASGGGGGTGYFASSVRRWVPGGTGIPGQGHNGGYETNNTSRTYVVGGGGGGAGEPGQDGCVGPQTYSSTGQTVSRITGGCGGDGVMCPIWGDRWYGGGGGGGAGDSAVFEEGRVLQGGRGGGGAGGWSKKNNSGSEPTPGEPGVPGTGGGGGGSACESADFSKDSLHGGDGGSGVVILRYRTPAGTTPTLPDGAGVGGTQTKCRGWVRHVFTEDGTLVLTNATTADVLLVGGGGGGGGFHGGGGGGGGVVVCSNLLLEAGTYNVTIGVGGAPVSNTAGTGGRLRAKNGGTTAFSLDDGSFVLQAFGGGGGGCRFHGQDGATGGGGASMDVYTTSSPESGPNTYRLGGYGLGGQGYDGGYGTNTTSHFFQFGGGGGGAGGPGSNAWYVSNSDSGPGVGGIGVLCDFVGEPTYYGGGGGGGASGRPKQGKGGAGGLGGGGAGGGGDTQWISPDHSVTNRCSPGADGVNGLGGGGGGGGSNVQAAAGGGKGGSGVVVVRYRLRPAGIIFLFK